MGILSRIFGKPKNTALKLNIPAKPPTQTTPSKPESQTASQGNNDPAAIMMAAHNGQTETVRQLISKGIGIRFMDAALLETAIEGHTETARLLIDKGANVNANVTANEKGMIQFRCDGSQRIIRSLHTYVIKICDCLGRQSSLAASCFGVGHSKQQRMQPLHGVIARRCFCIQCIQPVRGLTWQHP